MKFNAAFWKWFGDSKVVDAKGRPLVVYHGATEDVKPKDRYHPVRGGEIWFTSDPKIASIYAEARSRHKIARGGNAFPAMMAVFLSFQRPLIVDADGAEYDQIYWRGETWISDEIPAYAKSHNFDGVMIRNLNDVAGIADTPDHYDEDFSPVSDVYVAFDPTQIKSATGNDGTFDDDDPDIRSNPMEDHSRQATLDEVIDNLEETDSSGDGKWIDSLIDRVSQFKKWREGPIRIRDIDNGNTSSKSYLRSMLEDQGDNAWPSVVLIPSRRPRKKWEVIDGGHRTAASQLDPLNKERIVWAFYPVM